MYQAGQAEEAASQAGERVGGEVAGHRPELHREVPLHGAVGGAPGENAKIVHQENAIFNEGSTDRTLIECTAIISDLQILLRNVMYIFIFVTYRDYYSLV